ncbi:MAG TPA: lanthionine synthetase LanC family protein [Thermoanaerobaculia bacterium]|nr:lanthionine synthetase LanC family protein [Thermoanaerobaculia bacterium]
MSYNVPFTLSPDSLLLPVAALAEDTRSRLDCGEEDFALSRPNARTGSKILDPDSATLVRCFEAPRTLVEAVILFGREQGVDPEEVLDEAFPLLKGLVDAGFLIPADAVDEAGTLSLQPGAEVPGGRVQRLLQVLEDTEVHLVAREDGWSVFKVAREPVSGRPLGVEQRLEREARLLSHLEGGPVPRLLAQGELGGRPYLELSYCTGVDAATAAAEPRERGERRTLLALLSAVAAAYAELHRRGVIHGDVHPRNLLVDGEGRVTLLDFGLARAVAEGSQLPSRAERGGVPFFFEPELARAYLAGTPAPPASFASEQHALGVLLYHLATGSFPRDYSLGREAMLGEIVEAPPLSFAERGVASWPELEAVLAPTLAKRPEDRYPSLAPLVAALERLGRVPEPSPAGVRHGSPPALERLLERCLAAAALDGPWLTPGALPAPSASINYGAAGIALGLLSIAERRRDAGLLSLADVWAERAAAVGEADEGFYQPAIQISREIVGEASPYHSPSGVAAARALVAASAGDPHRFEGAIERYLEVAARPANGLDLTLGRASTLLAAALLLDRAPTGVLTGPLIEHGDRELAALWEKLEGEPAIVEGSIDYLGMAHGWAGFLFASLEWCRASGAPLPPALEGRLVELSRLAQPAGRGLAWPWQWRRTGTEPSFMAGWCNGSCGYVFLWTLAERTFEDGRFLPLARGAAWDSWDAPDRISQLCCGLAGRAYALLNLWRLTAEPVWLARARELAGRGASEGQAPGEHPHSLYKGDLGLAVLAADLERPLEAAQPFFEGSSRFAPKRAG